MRQDGDRVPADPEEMATLLERHEDFRVQRRMAPMQRRLHGAQPSGCLVGIAIDVETTGLDSRRHEIIELAVQRFRIDALGRIVETGRPRRWLEQPAEPIAAVVTRLTGLTDADVAGRAIADGEASGMLMDADFVVAHNSTFDRPFLERRLPVAAGLAWACSLSDIDWPTLGFEGRRLSELVGRMGWFYDAHRAEADVTALLHLLDHRLPDGITVASLMLATARRPSWIVDAIDAPFSAKDCLKARGYRWDGSAKIWSAAVAKEAVAEEVAWAERAIYSGRRQPAVRMVTWRERYAQNRS